MKLPPCGLYRTTDVIGPVPAQRLVYFHNHGEPGPGIYPPKSWKGNRVVFNPQGIVLPHERDAANLEPLVPEGFYRVTEPFYCCEKKCRRFETDMLVQLGYNGEASPILFVPEFTDGMLALPNQGTNVESDTLDKISLLKVPMPASPKVRH